jgi:hypothetical protein
MSASAFFSNSTLPPSPSMRIAFGAAVWNGSPGLGAGAASAVVPASPLTSKPKQSARRRKLKVIAIIAIERGRPVAIALRI